MDFYHRSAYSCLSNEDWVKLGYEYLREDDLGLTSDIHPLFQRTNASRPSGAEHVWPQYKSEGEYESMCAEMGTILRMASKMVESPDSLDFLYQVASSPRKFSETGFSNQKRPCKEFGWHEPPTQDIGRSMAKDALRRLSSSLMIQVGEPEANPALRGTIAMTSSTLNKFPNGVKINDASKPGIASRITLNQDCILMLRDLNAQEGVCTSQRLSVEVILAMTLCHEIAHALAFAVDWEFLQRMFDELNAANLAFREGRAYQPRVVGTDEPFYKNEKMAELGKSWECRVFGGQISWSGFASDPLFVSTGPSFFNKDDKTPKRGREKRIVRKYVISLHFIRNMHRQAFWDQVKRDHTSVLYINKTIGIEYQNPFDDTGSGYSSENDWPAEVSGRLSRERNGQPVPDPSDAHANETEDERRASQLASESQVGVVNAKL